MKTISIRPTPMIMNLEKIIRDHYFPGTTRVDIFNTAVKYSLAQNVDWKYLNENVICSEFDSSVEVPNQIHFKIKEEVYLEICESIKSSFDGLKIVRGPFFCKLVLLNLYNGLKNNMLYFTNPEKIYEPIREELRYWLEGEINKLPEGATQVEKDICRVMSDRDCILTNGNLYADTIVSLWLPFRFAFIKLNPDYRKTRVKKERVFLEEMIAHLELYFPIENEITKQLSKLFTLGITRANVMILPKRILQKRGEAPYYDYMPHFLADILEHQKISVSEQEGVKEILAFENMKEAIEWIEKENLTVFFAGKEIALENIINIHCTDDAKCNLPREGGIDKLDVLKMLQKYNQILTERQRYFSY